MTDSIVVGSIKPELIREAESLRELAAGYQITCVELREAASDDLKRIKGLQRVVEDERTSITKPLNEALRRVNAMFKKPAEWLDEAERVLKRAALTYDHEQESKRLADQIEANILADIERRRLEEAAQREAAAGNAETAQAIKEAAAMTAPVPVVSEAPKITGESHREVWRAEIIDESLIPREYLVPDMQKLNASARMFKGALAIPGVRSVCEKILASRAA